MFRPMLRPGQGFKRFRVLRKVSGLTDSGRPHTGSKKSQGEFYGIISDADPKDVEQYKQKGTPITHTIVQLGTTHRAKADDVLELMESQCGDKTRQFLVRQKPKDPGELGHVLIYMVEERDDLK